MVVVCLFACSKEVEITLPLPEKRIVVNSFFCPDSIWTIYVSSNGSIKNNHGVAAMPPIEDAKVEIWEGSHFVGELQHKGSGKYILPVYPQKGKTYTVKVSAKDYPNVEATDRIPTHSPTAISGSIDWKHSQVVNEIGSTYDVFPTQFVFQDSIGGNNYYYLKGYYYDSCNTLWGGNVVLLNHLYPKRWGYRFIPNDVIIDPISKEIQEILFQDKQIDGDSYSLNLQITKGNSGFNDIQFTCIQPEDGTTEPIGYGLNPPEENYLEMYIELQNVSEAMYYFIRSYHLQAKNFPDPFATYNNAYSNVKGGRGIFCGYSGHKVLVFQGKIGF